MNKVYLPESMVGWSGWLQDVAQMTEKITYGDIKSEVTSETARKLKNLKASWNRECYYDEPRQEKLDIIGDKVTALLRGE